MNTNTEPVEQSGVEDEPNPMVAATRKILFAAIGVVALGKDKVEDFMAKLIERGKFVEKDKRLQINEDVKIVEESGKVTVGDVNQYVLDILDRMNVPTKTDIDTLSEQVDLLANHIDELTKVKS
jgi:poly(hydroxyalkanoate) granule-associated protein